MKAVLFSLAWGVLFFVSYLCMGWRQKVCGIVYDSEDIKPNLLVSLIIPPIGIFFSLAEVAACRLGFRKVGEHAV